MLSTSDDDTDQQVPPNTNTPNESRGLLHQLQEYPLMNHTFIHLSRVYQGAHQSSFRLVRLGATTMEYSYRLVEPQLRTLDHYVGLQFSRLTGGGDRQRVIEWTVEGLRSAEDHILLLLNGVRESLSHYTTTSSDLNSMRSQVTNDIINTLKNCVEMVNQTGKALPLPGQTALKDFLLSLPSRFGRGLSAAGSSATGRVFLLADETLISIKSLLNIILHYGEDDPLDQDHEDTSILDDDQSPLISE